jgi:hypothetical protein
LHQSTDQSKYQEHNEQDTSAIMASTGNTSAQRSVITSVFAQLAAHLRRNAAAMGPNTRTLVNVPLFAMRSS